MIPKPKTNSAFPITLFLISFAVYIISFALPVFTMEDFDGSKTMNGITAFFMGAMAILGGGLTEWLVWLANPFYIISVYLKRRQKKSSITFSWLATLVALSSSFWNEVLAAESGRTAPISHKELGYLFWVASFLIWTIGLSFRDKKQSASK